MPRRPRAAAQAALRRGDFAAYGAEEKKLAAALQPHCCGGRYAVDEGDAESDLDTVDRAVRLAALVWIAVAARAIVAGPTRGGAAR